MIKFEESFDLVVIAVTPGKEHAPCEAVTKVSDSLSIWDF